MIKTALEIVESSELKKFLKKRSLESFFTSSELKNSQNDLLHLAGKLAAKRAFFNAFERERGYKKIEIKNSSSGKPVINVLDADLKNEISDYKISISISHTKSIAVAFCLICDIKNGQISF